MGNQSQSLANNQRILQKYTLVKQPSQGKNLYKHTVSKKQFISIQRTFPNQQAIKDYEKSIQKLLEIKHPYFLNETQHTMVTASMLCSVQYRVVHFFEYEPHTLEYQLSTRKTHERYFEEKEIWSILCSMVLAMAHLTKKDVSIYTLHPMDIVIDKAGMIKILSPLLTDQQNHQVIDHTLYYSPQHLKAIKTQSFQQISNKSCVFTLGITLLHIMSLQPMNELYNYENCTINMELLNQLIEKIAHLEIREVIKKMVKFHGYDRITFTELEDMLYNILEGEEGEAYAQEHEKQLGHSKLSNSIHQLNHSGLNIYIQQKGSKDSHSISYQTGASSHRDHNPSNQHLSIGKTLLKPLPNDPSDTSTFPVNESAIDIQKVDQQDPNNQNILKLQQPQKNKLPESHYTYGTSSLSNSNLYQTADNKTLRKVLHQVNSFQNITLGKNLLPEQQQKHSHISNTRLTQSEMNNKPHHVRQQLKRGIYQGYKLNNMRHGYGVFYYSDGGKYAGEWVRNKMQGRGALYYSNDQIAYQGEWHNDKLHGYGVLYDELPSYVAQPFDYRELHLVDNLWVKYQGNFYEDEKMGEGTLYLSNGECYRGSFSKDLPNGNGVYECLNGKIVKGNWVLGMMQ